MTVMTVAVYPSPARSTVPVDVRGVFTAQNSSAPRPLNMPASISRSQLYYWTAKWQADEAESLAEIEAGRVERFASGQAAVAWLLSTDDEDGEEEG